MKTIDLKVSPWNFSKISTFFAIVIKFPESSLRLTALLYSGQACWTFGERLFDSTFCLEKETAHAEGQRKETNAERRKKENTNLTERANRH